MLAAYGVRLLGTPLPRSRPPRTAHAFADAAGSDRPAGAAPRRRHRPWPRPKRSPQTTGFPLVVRAAFCLGGTGSGVRLRHGRVGRAGGRGPAAQPGRPGACWKRACWAGPRSSTKCVRDAADNAIISLQHGEPGPDGHPHRRVHRRRAQPDARPTRDYQRLRTAALTIVRALGVQGGCNCQFALNQQTGEVP